MAGDRALSSATRRRVFALLRDGLSVPKAAGRIGVSRQALGRHAAALVEAGALRIVPGTWSPKLYEPGPQAAAFERAGGATHQTVAGRSPFPPADACYVHGWAWRWRIEGPPKKAPPFGDSWDASGVLCREWRPKIRGARWVVREVIGKTRASLTIRPPGRYVGAADDVPAVTEEVGREVARFVRRLAESPDAEGAGCGYRLVGALALRSKPEMAFEIPKQAAEGRARDSPVWVDGSPEGGRSEAETLDVPLSVALGRTREWRADMESRVGAMTAKLDVIEDGQDAVFGIMTKIITAMERAEQNTRMMVETAFVPGPEVA